MGLEIVRSSTPAPVREWLKEETVSLCLNQDEKDLQNYVEETQKFKELPPEDIAFPRGCNNIDRYVSRETVYTKGTPMHVRGAFGLQSLGQDSETREQVSDHPRW